MIKYTAGWVVFDGKNHVKHPGGVIQRKERIISTHYRVVANAKSGNTPAGCLPTDTKNLMPWPSPRDMKWLFKKNN
jgi:hypothetical protein